MAGLVAKQWLAQLARGSRRWIWATALAGAVAGGATIAQMILLARIVDLGLIKQVTMAELTPMFVGLVLVLVVRALGEGLQTRLALRCSEQVRRDARRQIHNHWRATGPVELGQSTAETLARDWIDRVDAMHGYFAWFVPQLIQAAVVPLLVLGVVSWLNWRVGLLLAFSAALIPLFLGLVDINAKKLNQRHFAAASGISGQFLDKVRGLTTLQLFGQANAAAELIRRRSDQYRKATMVTQRIALLSSAMVDLVASVAIAVVALYVGFALLGVHSEGPGDRLTLFSGLLMLLLTPEFFQPLRRLAQYYHQRAAALDAAGNLVRRLNRPVATRSTPASTETVAADHKIRLDSVSKVHQHRHPALRDLSLVIRQGEVIALTGPAGGGKSTLLHLLAGFSSPDTGQILLFGRAPGSFRFGWLSQQGFMVHGSWADNLRLTRPDASDIAMATALHNVGLDYLLDSRSSGIHSPIVGESQGLSVGQARRLSLARIFLADYPLILMDEPTASLDTDSEIFVLEAMHKLALAGKTLIFSTHHPALLTLANRVLLVSDGKVRDA